MPKLICATPLLELAIDNLHHLVRDEAYRVSKVIDNEFHNEPFEGTKNYCQEMADDLTTKGEIYLDDQIGVFKEHIYSHIAFNLIDRIQNSLLLGITKAIKLKKREWSPNILMSKFNKSLGAIIEFAELMIVPSRKVLDFENVPNMVKSRLFKNLPGFVNTTTLVGQI